MPSLIFLILKEKILALLLLIITLINTVSFTRNLMGVKYKNKYQQVQFQKYKNYRVFSRYEFFKEAIKFFTKF